MGITQMLGVLAVVFFAAMTLMCLFRDHLNNPVLNPLFLCACVLLFFCWNYAMFEHNGLKKGFMTLDNISPYICTIIPITPFLNKQVKNFAYSAIACLAFGMFVALFISAEVEHLVNHHQTAKFLHASEAACHLIMSLYGFYLILARKVKLEWKTYGKALIFIYGTITFGIVLNWFFKKGNFGMDMHGDYSIYFMDLFDSFEATLLAYLAGVFITITLGFLVGIGLDRFCHPPKKKCPEEEKPNASQTIEKQLDS